MSKASHGLAATLRATRAIPDLGKRLEKVQQHLATIKRYQSLFKEERSAIYVELRDDYGWTFTEIAEAAGESRQLVHQQYGTEKYERYVQRMASESAEH